MLVLGLAACLGCGGDQKSSEGNRPDGSPPSGGEAPSTSAAAPAPEDARAVLEAMAKAYTSAPGYQDRGYVVLRGRVDGQPAEHKLDYQVALARPGRIRVQVYSGTMVCDGQTFYGSVAAAPQRVLRRPVPAPFGIRTLWADMILARSLADGPTISFSWPPIQVVLLMAEDPLKTLLERQTALTLISPGQIEEHPCHRVEVSRPEGKTVYWIDKEDHVLRRIEYPVSLFSPSGAAADSPVESFTVELADARLAAPSDPRAFAYEVPEAARTVDALIPLELEKLGQPAPEFFFVGLDGKSVTLKSLAGKVVLLDFWATWCEPCREWLPALQAVYDRYRDDARVAFLAVSVDAAKVSDADVKKVLDELRVQIPGYRDSQQFAFEKFGVVGVPTTLLIGSDGKIQDFESGARPGASGMLAGRIERLLAGKDLSADARQAFAAESADYASDLEQMVKTDLFIHPRDRIMGMPETSAAERSAPERMKLSPLWRCDELDMPGDLLAVERSDGPPRLFVVNQGRTIVELDTQGKVIARAELKLPSAEPIQFLRTAVGPAGKRYFLGSAHGGQQVHLFDDGWQLLSSFPPEATTNRHAGVADVQVADFDGDGGLEVCVGFRELVGVKCVALDGATLGPVKWSQRGVANVTKMALGRLDAQRKRTVLCTNDRSSLAVIDAAGHMAGEISLDGRLLYWVSSANPDDPGPVQMCGLSAPKEGQNVALGMDAAGNLLWQCELPDGLPYGSRLATPVRIVPAQPTQWLLVGADASLHLVSAEGRRLDGFRYGAAIHSVAVVELDGQNVLIVASPGSVEALRVEWPGL